MGPQPNMCSEKRGILGAQIGTEVEHHGDDISTSQGAPDGQRTRRGWG